MTAAGCARRALFRPQYTIITNAGPCAVCAYGPHSKQVVQRLQSAPLPRSESASTCVSGADILGRDAASPTICPLFSKHLNRVKRVDCVSWLRLTADARGK